MKNILKNIKGTKDISAEESYIWQYIENYIHNFFDSFGYSEVRTPTFENTELFVRSIGGDTDIVSKEMYSWTDQGNNTLTLRPEFTASVVRYFIQNQLHKINPSHKIYYIGSSFRRERPQKGRLREFRQFGIEAFGSKNPEQDAEIISMAYNFYKNLDISNLKLELNSIGSKESRIEYRKVLKSYLEKFKTDLSEVSQKRLESNPLRILDSKDPKTLEILEKSPSYTDFLEPDQVSILNNLLDDFGKSNITINSKLVRGLDYYTGFVFEVTSKELGSQDSFIGGGRYDNLFSSLGGQDIPAIGFAIGLERMIDIMPESSKASKKVFIVNITSNNSRYPYKIAQNLRSLDKNIVVEDPLLTSSAKSQLRRANKVGAAVALIIGDDEVSKNEIIWKDLDSKIEQQSLSLDELINKFNEL